MGSTLNTESVWIIMISSCMRGLNPKEGHASLNKLYYGLDWVIHRTNMISIERGCDEKYNCMDNGDHVVIPSQSEVPHAANSNVFIY